MIAKLVSDQWHQEAENEIFIDRDGTLFQSVLNYIRDGKVYLPITVSKAALMNELAYFGFEDVDESNIDDGRAQGVLAVNAYNVLLKTSKEAYEESDCHFIVGYMIDQYVKTMAEG